MNYYYTTFTLFVLCMGLSTIQAMNCKSILNALEEQRETQQVKPCCIFCSTPIADDCINLSSTCGLEQGLIHCFHLDCLESLP